VPLNMHGLNATHRQGIVGEFQRVWRVVTLSVASKRWRANHRGVIIPGVKQMNAIHVFGSIFAQKTAINNKSSAAN